MVNRRGQCARTAWLALLMALSLTAAAFAAPGDGLEGTNWEFRPKGFFHWMAFWNRDYLVFQSGNFIEAGLANHGFTPSLYTASKTPSGIEWTCTLQNPNDGQIVWKATRVSYWMEGTYTRTGPGGSGKPVLWKAWQIFPKPPKS